MIYLQQTNGSLLVGISIFDDGHDIWVRLCNLSHPVADLQNRTPLHVTVTTSACAFRHAHADAFLTSAIVLYLK